MPNIDSFALEVDLHDQAILVAFDVEDRKLADPIR
jgi:hypothetical protein